MSRKAAIIEEFDDDTELPLPNQPLPNMGARGPLLEAIQSSDDDEDDDYLSRAGPASPGKSKSLFRPPPTDNSRLAGKGTVTDITPYKSSVVFILI
jgi:signal recognition particle subunit SRP19